MISPNIKLQSFPFLRQKNPFQLSQWSVLTSRTASHFICLLSVYKGILFSPLHTGHFWLLWSGPRHLKHCLCKSFGNKCMQQLMQYLILLLLNSYINEPSTAIKTFLKRMSHLLQVWDYFAAGVVLQLLSNAKGQVQNRIKSDMCHRKKKKPQPPPTHKNRCTLSVVPKNLAQ